MRRRPWSIGTAAALAVLLVASSAGPSAAAERRAQAIRVTGSNVVFSPNGDGRKDVGRVTYRLARPGPVTVAITTRGKRVLTQELGRKGKGTHTFRWDGTRRGEVVGDRTYTVTLRSGRASARTPLEVDAVYARKVVMGTLGLSSDTVYPRTTVIRDVVVGTFFPGEAFYALGEDGGRDRYDPVRREVLDAAGRIVSTAPVRAFDAELFHDECDTGCGRLSWDGRDDEGRRVATGTYRLRLVRTSEAGNRVVISASPPVTVSDRKLVARTTTVTTTPQNTTRGQFFVDVTAEPNDPPPRCAPVGSTRYSGGLSFRTTRVDAGQYQDHPCRAEAAFVGALPERRTPYDRYAVAATGGPATEGGAASGTLRVGEADGVRMAGDTTVSVTQRFAAYSEVTRAGAESPVIWGFSSGTEEPYDLATFRYTLTQYVPVP